MNLLSIRTSVRKRIGSPATTTIPDADLTDIINIAYRQIAARYRFHKCLVWSSVSTIAGTSVYALNASDLYVLDVYSRTKKRNLVRVAAMNLDVVDDSIAYPTNRGEPVRYFPDGANITLYPTPDAVYALRVHTKRLPATLVNDNDTPVFPEPWHECICLWARHVHFDIVGDMPKAQYAWNMVQSWLATYPGEYEEEQSTFVDSVEVSTLANVSRRHNFDTAD